MAEMASVNPLLVMEKLDTVRNCLTRLRSKAPATLRQLESDLDAQDILCINLERAVQACVDAAAHILAATGRPVPATMAEAFVTLAAHGVLESETAARLVKSVGPRNLIVHEYRKIDFSIIHAVVTSHLDTFEDFARQVLAALKHPGS